MRRLAVILGSGLLGLFGCHGRTLSRTDFLTRGNAACTVAAKRIHDLAVPRTSPAAGPEQFAGYVDEYVAEMRLELTNLRAIGYPPGQRASLEADYRRLDAQLTTAARQPLGFRPESLGPDELVLREAGLSACRE